MKKNWFGFLLLILSLVGTLAAYPYMPEQIPTHWNFKGVPDSFADKSSSIFLFPGIMLFMYILFLILPKIDPKKENFPRFQESYSKIMNGILLFMFLFQAVQITSSLNLVNPSYVVPELAGMLFIFVGNLSPKFKPNYFVGIRTPWTLANEDVWRKTHRFGGKVFVISGLLLLIVPIVPAVIQAYYVISVIVISLLLIVLSSYYFFIKV